MRMVYIHYWSMRKLSSNGLQHIEQMCRLNFEHVATKKAALVHQETERAAGQSAEVETCDSRFVGVSGP